MSTIQKLSDLRNKIEIDILNLEKRLKNPDYTSSYEYDLGKLHAFKNILKELYNI